MNRPDRDPTAAGVTGVVSTPPQPFVFVSNDGLAIRLVRKFVSGLAVAVYPVMVLPPLLVGAVQVGVMVPLLVVPVTFCGAVGIVAGVTLADWVESALFPALFVALTLT